MGHEFEELSSKVIAAALDVHNLKATGLCVGLLLNFNAPTLAIKRVVP